MTEETTVDHASVSPEEAADRLAIRELVDAYAYCADTRDADGLGATTWTAFTLPSAQDHVTHDATKVSAILVKAAPGVSSVALRVPSSATTSRSPSRGSSSCSR